MAAEDPFWMESSLNEDTARFQRCLIFTHVRLAPKEGPRHLLVCAPLRKRSIGRQRKNRIKGCLEGGSGGSKSGVKPAENENEKTKKMVRGRAKCKRCGELGHRQASYKCPLNGTKKRKRKPRKNTTRGWTPKDSTPDRAVNTREQIMQESPGIVTKRCLSLLMGEGTTSQEPLSSEITTTIATAPKKMTPRKAKRNLHICDV